VDKVGEGGGGGGVGGGEGGVGGGVWGGGGGGGGVVWFMICGPIPIVQVTCGWTTWEWL